MGFMLGKFRFGNHAEKPLAAEVSGHRSQYVSSGLEPEFAEGWLFAESPTYDPAYATISHLRKLLRQEGLSARGRKADLVEQMRSSGRLIHDPMSLTVSHLKELLRAQGLPLDGSKAKLVERLLSSASSVYDPEALTALQLRKRRELHSSPATEADLVVKQKVRPLGSARQRACMPGAARVALSCISEVSV